MDQWRPPFLHVTLSRFSKYEIIRWLWTWKVWSWKFRIFTLFHQNFSSKFSISKFIRILIPRIFEIRHSDRNFETRWLNIWNRWRHRWNQLWFHFGRIWIKKFDFWCHKMNKKWFWLKMKELEKKVQFYESESLRATISKGNWLLPSDVWPSIGYGE